VERRKNKPIPLEASVAAESILAFANEQLNKVAESDQQSTLEQVLKELQTWRAGIVAGDDYWRRLRLRLSK